MLRLLPKTVVIGLAPDSCWLRLGKRALRREVPAAGDIKLVLRELDAMLDDVASQTGRFAYAEVYLSDSYSRAMLVPWQGALDSEDQVQGYGRACLEEGGSIVDGEWAVHCGFRRHGLPGLAAALPMDLIRQIRDRLLAREIRLRTVMPVSAAAYWYHRADKRAGTSLLLLQEPKRLSTFAYSRGQLVSADVEPVLATGGDAVLRLVNRLRLAHGEIAHIQYWRSNLDGSEDAALSIDGAETVAVHRARWSFA